MSQMPIITLHQPWASWIAIGWKTIETRSHNRFRSLANKWVGIHAGKKWDKNAIGTARYYLSNEQIRITEEWFKKDGGIICVVKIGDVRPVTQYDSKAALISCDWPRWGLIINDVRVIPPILVKGHQGIWYYDMGETIITDG